MINKVNSGLRGHSWILVLSFLIVVALGTAQITTAFAFQSSRSIQEDRSNSEVVKKLKTASMQHEMILLLIEGKTFDRVESEWRTVLDLRLAPKYEGAIADSLLTIGYKLLEARQLALGQKLLDESLAAVPFSNKSKVEIFRFKAYLFKEAGDIDSAIKALKLANDLEGK